MVTRTNFGNNMGYLKILEEYKPKCFGINHHIGRKKNE
jgi:hypothetical protein